MLSLRSMDKILNPGADAAKKSLVSTMKNGPANMHRAKKICFLN